MSDDGRAEGPDGPCSSFDLGRLPPRSAESEALDRPQPVEEERGIRHAADVLGPEVAGHYVQAAYRALGEGEDPAVEEPRFDEIPRIDLATLENVVQ